MRGAARISNAEAAEDFGEERREIQRVDAKAENDFNHKRETERTMRHGKTGLRRELSFVCAPAPLSPQTGPRLRRRGNSAPRDGRVAELMILGT